MSNLTQEQPSDVLVRDLGEVVGEGSLTVDEALVRPHGRGFDALLDVSWLDTGKRMRTYRRTIAYFHRPESKLPEFTVQPKRGFMSRILLKILSMAGTPSLDLKDRPNLDRKVAIITFNADSVRALLGTTTLDAIAKTADLEVQVDRNGAAVWVPRTNSRVTVGRGSAGHGVYDERLKGSARMRLFERAWAVWGPVVDDSDAAERAAAAVSGSYADEAHRTMQEAGGLVGRMTQRHVITADMVERVLCQRPPRAGIPPQIARRAFGGTTFPLLILGFMAVVFLVIGTVVTTQQMSESDGQIPEEAAILLVPVLLVTIWCLVLRWRRGRQRILNRGRGIEAQVTKVEATSVSSGDQRIYRIHFAPTSGAKREITMTAGPDAARGARHLMEDERPARILVDPSRPSKGLWLDGWAIESVED